jgi:hypothetical protein
VPLRLTTGNPSLFLTLAPTHIDLRGALVQENDEVGKYKTWPSLLLNQAKIPIQLRSLQQPFLSPVFFSGYPNFTLSHF